MPVSTHRQLVEDGEDQRLLEDVVVERAQQLRHEKWQEAAFTEQGKLRFGSHGPLIPDAEG